MSGVQAKFFCKTGALAGSDHRIGEDATIGRGPGNTIVLSDDVVSQTHACIAFDPTSAAYFLEDLDSTNGTRLDGLPVSGRQRLGDLHVVTFGEQHDFIFAVLPDAGRQRERAERPERRRQEPAPQPVEPAPQPVEPATRYEQPPALDVPPLGVHPELQKGEPAAADSQKAAEDGASVDEAARPPVEPATRYEQPPALDVPPLDVPPLGVQPEPPEAEPAGGSPQAVRHEEPEDAVAEQAVEPATRYEPPPALDVPRLEGESAKPSGVTIEVVIASGDPRRITLGEGRHVAGRAKDCALPIDDMTLSRRHAAFVVRGDVVTVTDLKSLNGTFFEETPVETSTSVEIGQTVTLGNRVRIVRIAP